jgi:hypothetical protein
MFSVLSNNLIYCTKHKNKVKVAGLPFEDAKELFVIANADVILDVSFVGVILLVQLLKKKKTNAQTSYR